MRLLMVSLLVTVAMVANPGHADETDPGAAAAGRFDQLRQDSLRVRRHIGAWVLGGGAASVTTGAGLLSTSDFDHALRVAGAATLVGGIANVAVGGHALYGIARERHRLEDPNARAERRTLAGLHRAIQEAIADEQREALGHALNLGLDVGYAGIGGAAILASQLGADNPDRWLGAGVAIAVQAAFIIGLNIGGLVQARRFHRRLLTEQARITAP